MKRKKNGPVSFEISTKNKMKFMMLGSIRYFFISDDLSISSDGVFFFFFFSLKV